MPWRPLNTADFKFAPQELTALKAVAGANNGLAEALKNTVLKWVDAVSAVGNTVNRDGSVPDQLREDIVADAVWSFVSNFPAFRFAKTPERKAAYDRAQTTFKQILMQEYGPIASPFGTDTTTGNWNSKPKLIMRTDPTPLPRFQLQSSPTPIYANPNAPHDDVQTNVPGFAEAPLNLEAWTQNNAVLLVWEPVLAALTYNVYRGTAAGQESATPLATGVTTTTYKDSTAVNGTTYFYTVSAVNSLGESEESNEQWAIPTASPHP